MSWGNNPDLVELDTVQQGTEHIKRLVVLAGESIDLECQVLFASLPVNEVEWKMDGKPRTNQSKTQIEFTDKNGDTHVKDNWTIYNITEELDGSTVSCAYSKIQKRSADWAAFSERVEAVFSVFIVTIETSEEVCKTCNGNIKLMFKESMKSIPGENNLEKRIKSKIAQMTNLKSEDILTNNNQYTVYLPISTVMSNQEILSMKPKGIINKSVSDSWPCTCESLTASELQFRGGLGIGIGAATAAGALLVLALACTMLCTKGKYSKRHIGFCCITKNKDSVSKSVLVTMDQKSGCDQENGELTKKDTASRSALVTTEQKSGCAEEKGELLGH